MREDVGFIFTTLLFIALLPLNALAEKRVALVIGNSAYTNISTLANPINDAKLMAKVLGAQGFEVVLGLDLKYRPMKRSIRRFTHKLQSYGRDTIGFIFYAGHGLQVRGTNYLIPVSAEIEKEGDVDIEAISASSLLFGVREARNRLNIIVLDACRNNPYRSLFRSASRGLQQMNAPMGSLIAFSTSPGDVAADGDGQNSPFTAALAGSMSVPGLTIENIFKVARRKVYESSKKKQLPWINSSLLGEFYPAGLAKAVKKKPTSTPTKAPSQLLSSTSIELAFWQAAKDQGSRRSYEAYVQKFPKGNFAPLAHMKLDEFKRAAQTRAKQKAELREARKKQNEAATKKRNVEVARRKKELNDLRLKQKAEREQLAQERDDLAKRLEAMEEETRKRADAIESKRMKIAALEPEKTKVNAKAVTTPIPMPKLDAKTMALVLQNELKRVGCDPGKVGGRWGKQGKNALSKFNKYAKLQVPTGKPSMDAINVIRAKRQRVCPLVCGVRHRIDDNQCVRKTCRKGQELNKRGKCIKLVVKKTSSKRKKVTKQKSTKKKGKANSKYRDCKSRYGFQSCKHLKF